MSTWLFQSIIHWPILIQSMLCFSPRPSISKSFGTNATEQPPPLMAMCKKNIVCRELLSGWVLTERQSLVPSEQKIFEISGTFQLKVIHVKRLVCKFRDTFSSYSAVF